ncbi:glycosyltransferase family 39 protein [Nocardia sp. NPDC019395]|uniref:ArnT family glycosyltransferase n=1 Tax=Nocardia sp. NPDC019395 TaxID=3154686 RepID=UPI0033C0C839
MSSPRIAPPTGTPDVRRPRTSGVPPFATVPVAIPAFVAGVVFLLRVDRYGHFGDELYFLAAGRHLAAGYVDQGPVVAVIARAVDLLAPGSLVVLRTPAVLATVTAIVITAAVAREFGGDTRAQVLAALAYATSPFALSQAASLSTFALDSTCSALVVWLLVRWTRIRDDRLIPVAFCAAALDLQIKWLAIVVLIGLAAGIASLGPRDLLRNRVFWVSGAGAAVTVLPAIVWQAGHGWPQWAMGEAIRAEQQLATGGRAALLGHQFVQAGALGSILLAAATAGFLRYEGLRRYRFVAVAAAVALLFVFVTATRPYYTAAVLPAVFAAGAVAVTASSWRWWRRLHLGLGAVSAVIALAAVVALPRPADSLREPSDSATQVYSRMRIYGTSGWPELTVTVTGAYRALPADVARRTVIVTDSYWQASGLEHFAGEELPPIYSPNRGYAYFGRPPDATGNVLYVGPWRGGTGLCAHFRTATAVAAADDPLGFPGISRSVTVALCTEPLRPWHEIWTRTETLALDMGVA